MWRETQKTKISFFFSIFRALAKGFHLTQKDTFERIKKLRFGANSHKVNSVGIKNTFGLTNLTTHHLRCKGHLIWCCWCFFFWFICFGLSVEFFGFGQMLTIFTLYGEQKFKESRLQYKTIHCHDRKNINAQLFFRVLSLLFRVWWFSCWLEWLFLTLSVSLRMLWPLRFSIALELSGHKESMCWFETSPSKARLWWLHVWVQHFLAHSFTATKWFIDIEL